MGSGPSQSDNSKHSNPAIPDSMGGRRLTSHGNTDDKYQVPDDAQPKRAIWSAYPMREPIPKKETTTRNKSAPGNVLGTDAATRQRPLPPSPFGSLSTIQEVMTTLFDRKNSKEQEQKRMRFGEEEKRMKKEYQQLLEQQEAMQRRLEKQEREKESARYIVEERLGELEKAAKKDEAIKQRLQRKLDVLKRKFDDVQRLREAELEQSIRHSKTNENLNDDWRRREVVKRFDELRTNGRNDFLDSLYEEGMVDSRSTTLPALKLPTLVFMQCYHTATDFFCDFEEGLQADVRRKLKLSSEPQISQAFITEIKFLFKKYVEDSDKQQMVKETLQRLKKPVTARYHLFLKDTDAGKTFMNKCMLIAWAMAIQHPPMRPVADDKLFVRYRHDLYAECDAKVKNIDYFVWPLVEGSVEGEVLAKGLVFTAKYE